MQSLDDGYHPGKCRLTQGPFSAGSTPINISLIFLMKRLFRLNDLALTEEILRLLASNPYRDDASKPYESRWSLRFFDR